MKIWTEVSVVTTSSSILIRPINEWLLYTISLSRI
ncbi:uncharacterized protein G2W53_006943 [Senna tora]|uniref:Uncharacterized protein n=1 Tax=Senna tora TaxID=362788 RepID=A0A834X593_9FABA|nr:uncharacterized protein G2W53_006943 [Senna tora]